MYAVVNLFAHLIACFAPIVAEIPNPVPFVAFLAAIGISFLATSALTELDDSPSLGPQSEVQKDEAQKV